MPEFPERVVCAKCNRYLPRPDMTLIRMGHAKRLVCKTCAEKRSTSWLKHKG